MKVSNENYAVDLNKISPLKNETKYNLEKYLFNDGLTGGCGKLQKFAIKAEALQSLQDQLKNGEIDLGWKDRTKAVAKCIGLALLVAVAAAAAFALTSTLGLIAGFGPPVFCTPLFASIAVFAVTCGEASEVFQKPSPEQLAKELDQLKNTEFSEEDVQNIKKTLENLNELADSNRKDARAAQERGDSIRATSLNANANNLMRAHKDLSKMLGALIPPASESGKLLVS